MRWKIFGAASAALMLALEAAEGQQGCFVPQVGLSCSNVGFATQAAKKCKNIKLLSAPDSLLSAQPDFDLGKRMFDMRVTTNSLEEACSFALRVYGSTLSGGLVLIAPR